MYFKLNFKKEKKKSSLEREKERVVSVTIGVHWSDWFNLHTVFLVFFQTTEWGRSAVFSDPHFFFFFNPPWKWSFTSNRTTTSPTFSLSFFSLSSAHQKSQLWVCLLVTHFHSFENLHCFSSSSFIFSLFLSQCFSDSVTTAAVLWWVDWFFTIPIMLWFPINFAEGGASNPMLDLNLEVVSSESASDSVEMVTERFLQFPANRMESAGSFNSSSVVNGDLSASTTGDEDSSSNADEAFPFTFVKDSAVQESLTAKSLCVFDDPRDQTMELFPLTGGFSSGSSPQKRWPEVSPPEFGYCGGVPERRINAPPAQQQHQPMRKNRRGPRSRSSQYRGVTFYRRTGRWESHIW